MRAFVKETSFVAAAFSCGGFFLPKRGKSGDRGTVLWLQNKKGDREPSPVSHVFLLVEL